jgi:ligand-binding SRPBCC domain-containing protein
MARGFAFRFPRVEQALKDILDESTACLIRAASADELPDSAYMRERPANRLLLQQTDFPLPVEQIFPFFTQLANLGALTPSAFAFEVDAPEKIELAAGAVIEQRWRTVIELWEPGRRFADAQHRGPFASWWHEHSFEPLPDGGCRMTDRVYYATPLGLVGQPVRSAFVEPQLRTIFAWRARALSRRFGGQVLPPA